MCSNFFDFSILGPYQKNFLLWLDNVQNCYKYRKFLSFSNFWKNRFLLRKPSIAKTRTVDCCRHRCHRRPRGSIGDERVTPTHTLSDSYDTNHHCVIWVLLPFVRGDPNFRGENKIKSARSRTGLSSTRFSGEKSDPAASPGRNYLKYDLEPVECTSFLNKFLFCNYTRTWIGKKRPFRSIYSGCINLVQRTESPAHVGNRLGRTWNALAASHERLRRARKNGLMRLWHRRFPVNYYCYCLIFIIHIYVLALLRRLKMSGS